MQAVSGFSYLCLKHVDRNSVHRAAIIVAVGKEVGGDVPMLCWFKADAMFPNQLGLKKVSVPSEFRGFKAARESLIPKQLIDIA